MSMKSDEAIQDLQFLARRYDELMEVYMSVHRESLDMAIKALMENQRYHEIGTVEELKALKEKNEPKKPRWHGHHFCPNCNSIVYVNGGKDIYCPKCGQKLDWE